MEGLEKRVAGDWFDIKECSENLRDLEDYFEFTGPVYRETAGELRLSVEEGVVEYKRNVARPLYSFLESLQYDSKGLDSLIKHAQKLAPLIYCLLLQRHLARGTVPVRKTNFSFDPDKQFGIKEIIQDVNYRLKEEPSLSQHPAIKNILYQINTYKGELENMKKLSPNIPKEKAESFSDNFKKTFSEIHQRIEENYTSFLREEVEKTHETIPTNVLELYDIKPLAKLYMSQAQKIAELRSTLTFAEEEGFRTRAVLVGMFNEKERVLGSFENEKKEYMRIAGDSRQGIKISKAFSSEMIYRLERAAARLERETVSQ
jgi:hypothetical protein